MSDKIVDAEFIDAKPAVRAPTSHKCHCPACRTMIASGNFCDACMSTCVPALRQIHAHQPALARGQEDGRALIDGAKAASRVLGGIADIANAFTGKPRRRRLR